MRGRKKLVPLAVISLLAWLIVVWLIFSFTPVSQVKIFNFQFSIFNLFFPLFFVASSLSLALLLNNTRRGILLGLGVTIFLVLRLLKLTHLFYLFILVGMIIALEFSFRKR